MQRNKKKDCAFKKPFPGISLKIVVFPGFKIQIFFKTNETTSKEF